MIALFITIELVSASAAHARGGASNIMNSPGYQRRLQESRGYVTNRFGSLLAPPLATVNPRAVAPKHRYRR
ncbi:hypothetical protein [Tardiphaga sp.]|uniref:hypothetical protein n=1 Tax=Tardiphaga sp. TaxID=1926292 RepID=UPI002608A3C4|nr:hypothetical protein [Tardiphaga sp.]